MSATFNLSENKKSGTILKNSICPKDFFFLIYMHESHQYHVQMLKITLKVRKLEKKNG